jgi:hypothetical protein
MERSELLVKDRSTLNNRLDTTNFNSPRPRHGIDLDIIYLEWGGIATELQINLMWNWKS